MNFTKSSEEILRLHLRCKEYGIRLQELALLCLVRSGKMVRLTGVAGLLGVSSGAVTMLARKLERRGLAKRVPSAADLRRVYLELTDDGKEAVRLLAGEE